MWFWTVFQVGIHLATITYAHSAGTRQAYPVLLLFAMSSVQVSPYYVTLRRVSDIVLGDRRYASHTRCRRNVYLENHQTIPAIKLSALLASVENKITDLLLRHAVLFNYCWDAPSSATQHGHIWNVARFRSGQSLCIDVIIRVDWLHVPMVCDCTVHAECVSSNSRNGIFWKY